MVWIALPSNSSRRQELPLSSARLVVSSSAVTDSRAKSLDLRNPLDRYWRSSYIAMDKLAPDVRFSRLDVQNVRRMSAVYPPRQDHTRCLRQKSQTQRITPYHQHLVRHYMTSTMHRQAGSYAHAAAWVICRSSSSEASCCRGQP